MTDETTIIDPLALQQQVIDPLALQQRVTELQTAYDADVAQWQQQREALLEDTSAALTARDTAEKRADKAEAALKQAKAKVSTGETPAKPRRLAAVASTPDRDTLKEKIAAAEKIEIAFSDGKQEVAGVAPIVVEGDVWREHALGLMLRDPVTVAGASGGSSVAVAGYALLLDGKQVAFTKRSDPLMIAPGQKLSLADDIYF